MKNSVFDIQFDEKKGLLTSLILYNDEEKANFIKEGRGLAEPHGVLWCAFGYKKAYKEIEPYQFESFTEQDKYATAVFSRRGVKIEETFILEENLLRIKISVKNKKGYPVYFKKEDCAFFMPFADSYDNSEICAKVRCHTHIAAFGENSYVQTERMGCSEYNVGVVLTKGSVDSYSQENCWESNNRGYFILNVSPFHLLNGQSHELEFVVFPHKGGDDFFVQAQKLTTYIHIFISSEMYYEQMCKELNLDPNAYEENFRLIQRQGPNIVIATFGEKGCKGVSGEKYFDVPAFSVKAVDTTGAGDVFHGAFDYFYLQGMSVEDCIKYSSAVSAIKCTRPGGRSGIPTVDVVEKFIKTGEIDYSEIDLRVAHYQEEGIQI